MSGLKAYLLQWVQYFLRFTALSQMLPRIYQPHAFDGARGLWRHLRTRLEKILYCWQACRKRLRLMLKLT